MNLSPLKQQDHISGTAYYQTVKPRSNEQIYGKPIRRTVEEAKQILAEVFERLNVGWGTLDEYSFNVLDKEKYSVYRENNLGIGMFNACYGVVRSNVKVVTFRDNIQSKNVYGKLFIPIQIHESVLDSDEAIVQVLYHEIWEIEELRYRIRSGVSVQAYWDMVRPDKAENLHYHAVQESDNLLLRYRRLLAKGAKP